MTDMTLCWKAGRMAFLANASSPSPSPLFHPPSTFGLTPNEMAAAVVWHRPTVLSDTCWSGVALMSRRLDQSGGGGRGREVEGPK